MFLEGKTGLGARAAGHIGAGQILLVLLPPTKMGHCLQMGVLHVHLPREKLVPCQRGPHINAEINTIK